MTKKEQRQYHRILTRKGIPRHKDGNRLGLLARKKLAGVTKQ